MYPNCNEFVNEETLAHAVTLIGKDNSKIYAEITNDGVIYSEVLTNAKN